MTIDELVVIVNQAFPSGAAQFAGALAMLNAQMELNIASSRQRLAQAAADNANQQAQAAIQQAQADALAAQAEFDAIVAGLANGH